MYVVSLSPPANSLEDLGVLVNDLSEPFLPSSTSDKTGWVYPVVMLYCTCDLLFFRPPSPFKYWGGAGGLIYSKVNRSQYSDISPASLISRYSITSQCLKMQVAK